MANSTSSRRGAKPDKPYPDFPLTPNGNGQWSKKIRKRVHYFGPWSDWQGALNRYLEVRDDLMAGRTPRPQNDDRLTVKELCDRFCTRWQDKLNAGEIVQRTFDDYYRACARLVRVFGRSAVVEELTPDDFAKLRLDITKTRGPVALNNERARIVTVLGFAWTERLIKAPVDFGNALDRAPRKLIRQARNQKAARMFEADECRALIAGASVHLRAMIYLGLNCGFGNSDCEQLSIDAVDVKTGWVRFPRPKTEVPRNVPLWPETVEAVRASLAQRSEPKDEKDAGLFFITKYGQSWHKPKEHGPVVLQFRRLLNALGLYKPGRGFYGLRHVFETIGGESRDQVAVDAIMGHVRDDMATMYRERISDERLQRVVGVVRDWVFGATGKCAEPEAGAKPERGDDASPDDRPRLRVVGSG